jgi:3-hydroxyisobutyrate dehydrogenase-like beta-hydroxyacid dehydrogenase
MSVPISEGGKVEQLGFLGIGLMGAPMVRRLLQAGFPVTVWNRTQAKAAALAEAGATVAAMPAEVGGASDIVITMLADGPTVGDVLFAQGLAEAMRPGSVLVDMSSIGVAEARDHAHRLAERGIGHLDAPVSGGTVGAEAGTLAIMAGGEAETFARVAPVFRAMGTAVHVGPSGAGQIAKLANQTIVANTIGAVAEALVLAERAGADPARVREALMGGFAGSRILEVHGARMIARDFEARGKISTHMKDLDNAFASAAEAGVDLPYAALSRTLFAEVLEGAGEMDHAGLWVALDRRARS